VFQGLSRTSTPIQKLSSPKSTEWMSRLNSSSSLVALAVDPLDHQRESALRDLIASADAVERIVDVCS